MAWQRVQRPVSPVGITENVLLRVLAADVTT